MASRVASRSPLSKKDRRLDKLVEQMADPKWRLRNLYWIRTEKGQELLFQPNWTQEDFLASMWYLNIILKARQLGFTTLIVLFMLDACLFNSNVHAGIIADTDDKAKEIFRDKIKFAYERLPVGMRLVRETVVDSVHSLEFNNGSSIRVGTSMRGLTLQYLLVTELGKISVQFPQKAEEIRTGSFNTVHAGQFIFIESTAEGQAGLFYELCDVAMKDKASNRQLTQLSFKFHFYPWFLDERYMLAEDAISGVIFTDQDRKYFAAVEAEMGVELTLGQKAWFLEKKRTQKEKMKSEFPSTPKEPFEVAVDGAYYANEMYRVREDGRILQLPWLRNVPVHSFWDLGHSDYTSIWLMQHVYPWHRFLAYYQNSGEQIAHYVGWLQAKLAQKGCVLGSVYLPHDATNKYVNAPKSTEELVRDILPGVNVVVLDAPNDKYFDGIEATRRALATAQFDTEGTVDGVKVLDGYRKQWNELLGVYRNQPMHNWASHGADAFEQFARGFIGEGNQRGFKRSASAKRSHRTV